MSDPIDQILSTSQETCGGRNDYRLHDMAHKALEMQEWIAQTEEVVKAAKSELHRIRTGPLVDLMAEVGTTKVQLEDGTSLATSQIVSGSLPKDAEARQEAVNWLREHDGAGLLRTQVIVDLPKGKEGDELARALMALIESSGHTPRLEAAVHPQSLAAFVRERMRDGKPVEPQKLGVFVADVVKVSPPKK